MSHPKRKHPIMDLQQNQILYSKNYEIFTQDKKNYVTTDAARGYDPLYADCISNYVGGIVSLCRKAFSDDNDHANNWEYRIKVKMASQNSQIMNLRGFMRAIKSAGVGSDIDIESYLRSIADFKENNPNTINHIIISHCYDPNDTLHQSKMNITMNYYEKLFHSESIHRRISTFEYLDGINDLWANRYELSGLRTIYSGTDVMSFDTLVNITTIFLESFRMHEASFAWCYIVQKMKGGKKRWNPSKIILYSAKDIAAKIKARKFIAIGIRMEGIVLEDRRITLSKHRIHPSDFDHVNFE
eukprot:903253_1